MTTVVYQAGQEILTATGQELHSFLCGLVLAGSWCWKRLLELWGREAW